MKACNRCEFSCSERCVGPLKPTKRADFMVVGESPGVTELFAEEVMVDESGGLLDYMLRVAGVTKNRRKYAYSTNALKCYPSIQKEGTDFEDLFALNVKKHHIQACRKRLVREISIVQPKVILALGTEKRKLKFWI